MQSYSEEDESLSFNNLLSGTRSSIIEMIDDSIQNVAELVEKQVNKTVKRVNKSAKNLFKGIKKKF